MAVQDMEVDAARGAGSHGVGGAGKEIAEASARKWRQIEEAAGDVNALEASEEWGEARQRAERVLSVEVAGMDVAAYDAAQGGPVRKMISLVLPRLVKSLRPEDNAAAPSLQEPATLSFLRAAASLIPVLLPSRSYPTLQFLEGLIELIAWIVGDSALADVLGSFPMDRLIAELRAAASEGAAQRCAALVKLPSLLCERGALSQEAALLLTRTKMFEDLLSSLSDEQFSKDSFPAICVVFHSYESVSRCSPALPRCALRPSPLSRPRTNTMGGASQPRATYPISLPLPQQPPPPAPFRCSAKLPSPLPALRGTALIEDRHAIWQDPATKRQAELGRGASPRANGGREGGHPPQLPGRSAQAGTGPYL